MANNRRGFPGKASLQFNYGPASSSSRREPPDKRRRVDSNQAQPSKPDDELWGDGDDLDFMTQDQFDNIDQQITMSQVPADNKQTNAAVTTLQSSGRMVGRGSQRSQSDGNILSNSSKMNTSQGGNLQSRNTLSKPASGFPQAKSQADTEMPFQNFTESASRNQQYSFNKQPNKMGSKFMPQQSASGRSYPQPKPQSVSASMLKNQLTPLTGSTGSGSYSPALPASGFSDAAQQQLVKLQKELTGLKLEHEKVNRIKTQKEGEANMLRSRLDNTQQKLNDCMNDQSKLRDHFKNEQSEKEKSLSAEIERLKTQKQFAERDRDELETRCKVLEKRSSAGGEGLNSPRPSQTRSPQRRPPQDKQSPRTPKSNFPSRSTFMAKASTSTARSQQLLEVVQPIKPSWEKKFTVNTRHENGRTSGSSLISLMLPKSTSDCIADQGIVGLLQVPPIRSLPLPSQNLSKDEEDKDKQEVTTMTNKWIQELHETSSYELEESSQIMPHKAYSLAVHAVSTLLRNDISSPTDDILLQGQTKEAIFMLPAIAGYLKLYAEQLQTVKGPSSSASSSSVTSLHSSVTSTMTGSIESYDSLSSHQKSLLTEIANYNEQVKLWALNALHILCVLVDFSPQVRLAIFGGTSPIGTGTKTEGLEQTSGADESADERNSSSSSETSSRSATQIARKCRIFEHLIRIANPLLPNNNIGCADVVEVSLSILSLLASRAAPERLMRFVPILNKDVLQNCLLEELTCPAEQRLRCHMTVVDIVTALTHCEHILPLLCINSKDCILYTIYCVVTEPSQGACEEYRTKLGLKLIQLVSSTLSIQPAGMTAILESECPCSCEVIKTVTLLLYHGLHAYRSEPSDHRLRLLQEGSTLLATIAQCSRSFVQQRRDFENQYVEVVTGLDVIFKDLDSSDSDSDIIHTLWDFDVDYSPNTDEPPETDDPMDDS